MNNNYASKYGYIYRLINSKDADKVVYVINPNGGKAALYAAGVKKLQSKKAHTLGLLNKIKYSTSLTNKDLATITEVRLISSPTSFDADLASLFAMQAICELVDLVALQDIAEVGIWNNLELITTSEKFAKPSLIFIAFAFKVFSFLGMLPRLDHDYLNGEPLNSTEPIFAATQELGLSHTQLDIEISVTLYKSIRFIMLSNYKVIDKLDLNAQQQITLLNLISHWAATATGSRLDTLPLLINSLA